MPVTFAEFIDNRDLAPDEFPHAAQGPAWLSRARKSLILAVAGTAFLAALHWGYIHAGRYVAIEGARADLTSTREILLTALWKIRQALGLVEAYRPAATALLWIYCAAMCAIYTGLLIARQRCFERDVVANDREALAMKKAILKRRKVTQKIAALEEKSKATTSRGTDLESKLDALFSPRGKEHESEIKGLKAFANLKVNINTRQSIESDTIEKSYIIHAKLPVVEEEKIVLEKCFKDLEYVARGVKKGKVSFGAALESSDHSRIYISDVIAVEDKYPERHLKIEKSSKKKKGGKKVESSFDLALFGDLSSEVDRKRVGALRWATSTEGVIDNILTTENMRVSRMKTDVSNTVALFTYKLSTTIDLSSVDKYNELIDNVLGLSGSDVSVREGKILVSVPLPDKHRAPIDIAQMYREAFFIKS